MRNWSKCCFSHSNWCILCYGGTRNRRRSNVFEGCKIFILSNAAFTLSGFDNQERNLTFVKTAFRVSKLKFLACSMEQAFHPIHKQNIARAWQQESTFLQAFRSVPGFQTCMCKRGITFLYTNKQHSQLCL